MEKESRFVVKVWPQMVKKWTVMLSLHQLVQIVLCVKLAAA